MLLLVPMTIKTIHRMDTQVKKDKETKTKVTPRSLTGNSIDVKGGPNEWANHLGIVYHSYSNCKLTIVEGLAYSVGSGQQCQTYKDWKDRFDVVLKNCRILVEVNTTDEDTVERIFKEYEIYDAVKVPVGYDNGLSNYKYQYHIFIRNPKSMNLSQDRYARPVEIDKEEILKRLFKTTALSSTPSKKK